MIAYLAFLLQYNCTAFNNNIEIIACFALFDDCFSIIKTAWFQSIGHSQTFPFIQTLCIYKINGINDIEINVADGIMEMIV